MSLSLLLPTALVVGQPLFGNQWLALLAVLAGVALFLFAIAGIGRWLAATHPDEPPQPPQPVAEVLQPPPAIFAVIAAAVATTLGARARIVSAIALAPDNELTVASSQLQWSLEGRRQIYSSHQVR
jgi:hypothetical protein